MTPTSSSGFRRLLILLIVSLVSADAAHARLVQIIHTNDLHSHLEHSGDSRFGGYAAVKSTMDQLKAQSAKDGIETITLDAGDFTEGSQFYLADRGEATWRTMDSMGYDAVTLGNHDWLAGADDLERILKNVKLRFNLLGANFIYDGHLRNIRTNLRPSVQLKRAGLRIAVLGLTTDEFVFNWRVGDGLIRPAKNEAADQLPKLVAQNDFVIALTHVGLLKDMKLAAGTSGIDLVVGGHSHSALTEPVYIIDKRGRRVPIVQAGAHGKYVGDLLVDLEPGQPVKVVRYRLIPVDANGPRDEVVEENVRQARAALDRDYGHGWLNEVIGYTEVPMVNPVKGPTVWAQFTIDAMREAVSADVALDVDLFYGNTMPAGPVTREQLFSFYPRVFDFKRYGWTIFKTKIRGWVLANAIEQAIKRGWWLNTSGLTYEIYYSGTERKVRNLRIKGKPLRDLTNYAVALPEGIGRGAKEIIPILSTIFQSNHDTKIPIWFALEDKLRQVGTVRPAPSP